MCIRVIDLRPCQVIRFGKNNNFTFPFVIRKPADPRRVFSLGGSMKHNLDDRAERIRTAILNFLEYLAIQIVDDLDRQPIKRPKSLKPQSNYSKTDRSNGVFDRDLKE